LEYWRDDPNTELILMYLESFGNPVRFVQLCRQITPHKPVFIVKSGHTGAGARAAASHTGALAQTALATDALITQAGAIRAEKVQDLFDMAMAFSNQPLPTGNRVAIVTNAGGPGIILADACEDNNLDVTALTPDTQEKLRSQLPDEASVRNPVDLIASATAQSYEFAVKTVLEDPNVDAAIAAFVPPLGIQTQEVAEAIVEANAMHPNKPLLTVLMGREGLPAGLAELREAKVPGYLFPESAARALGTMWQYVSKGKRRKGRTVSFDTDDDTVTAIIDSTLADNRLKLSEPDVLRVLEVDVRLARRTDEPRHRRESGGEEGRPAGCAEDREPRYHAQDGRRGRGVGCGVGRANRASRPCHGQERLRAPAHGKEEDRRETLDR
jgi:acyl-CoA synthetase (NDP forming)